MKKSFLLCFILCLLSACNANKINKTYPTETNSGSSESGGGGGGCCN